MRTEQEVVAAFERVLAHSLDRSLPAHRQALYFNVADALAWALGRDSFLESRLEEMPAAPGATDPCPDHLTDGLYLDDEEQVYVRGCPHCKKPG